MSVELGEVVTYEYGPESSDIQNTLGDPNGILGKLHLRILKRSWVGQIIKKCMIYRGVAADSRSACVRVSLASSHPLLTYAEIPSFS